MIAEKIKTKIAYVIPKMIISLAEYLCAIFQWLVLIIDLFVRYPYYGFISLGGKYNWIKPAIVNIKPIINLRINSSFRLFIDFGFIDKI